jgi:hypothetical protein
LYISVDPGSNVGVATFRDDGTDISKTVMSLPNFRIFISAAYKETLSSSRFNLHFIMEDFKLRQDKALDQTGSDMPASRCIGAVEMINDLLGDQSTITYQKPSVLGTALKWAGYSGLANSRRHPPDDIAAYAHGIFYLIENKLRKHPVFET